MKLFLPRRSRGKRLRLVLAIARMQPIAALLERIEQGVSFGTKKIMLLLLGNELDRPNGKFAETFHHMVVFFLSQKARACDRLNSA